MTYHIDGQQDYVEEHEVGDVITLPDHIEDRVLPEHKVISGWVSTTSVNTRHNIGDSLTVTDDTMLCAIIGTDREGCRDQLVTLLISVILLFIVAALVK